MTALPLYLLRHRPTGLYIPEPRGRADGHRGSRNGGSWAKPESPAEARPRVFKNHLAADAYLSQWLRGANTTEYDAGRAYPRLIHLPERQRNEFEVVTLTVEVP